MALVIETHRLILRPWEPRDAESFAALNADPRVMEFFPSTLSTAQSNALMEAIERKFEVNGFGVWAAEVKNSTTFIGFMGLNTPSDPLPFSPCVEILWRLAYEHWGNGYAPEGAKTALNFGFHDMHLPEIVSFTTEKNLRSRRVMEKIGMVRDASEDFDHPSLPQGHPLRKHVVYRKAS